MNPQILEPSMLLAQQLAFGNSSVTKDPRGSQLTIFYDGQVVVFDGIPAEKAKNIMSFASNGISQRQKSNYTHTFHANTATISATSSRLFPFHLDIMPTNVNNSVQEHPQASSKPVVCGLPLARKASLHRFLEKRKDRIAARAPYQTSNSMAAFINKSVESMSWLALAPKSPQDESHSSSNFVLF